MGDYIIWHGPGNQSILLKNNLKEIMSKAGYIIWYEPGKQSILLKNNLKDIMSKPAIKKENRRARKIIEMGSYNTSRIFLKSNLKGILTDGYFKLSLYFTSVVPSSETRMFNHKFTLHKRLQIYTVGSML